jgi:hypothetical protein
LPCRGQGSFVETVTRGLDDSGRRHLALGVDVDLHDYGSTDTRVQGVGWKLRFDALEQLGRFA